MLESQIVLSALEIKKRPTGDLLEEVSAIRRVVQELSNTFLSDAIDDLMDLFDEEFEHLEKQLNRVQKVTFEDVDAQIVEELIDLNLKNVQRVATKYIGDFEQAVIGNVITSTPFDVLKIAEDFGSRAAARVTTELDTGLATFNRTVSVNKALSLSESEDPKFEYVGPVDALTRPFCRAHVGQIKKRSEWSALNNGQTGDVMTTAGGYNCRHQLVWVGDDS